MERLDALHQAYLVQSTVHRTLNLTILVIRAKLSTALASEYLHT